MLFELRFTPKAQEDLSKLDRHLAGKIVDKIEYYVATGHPLRYSGKLKGALEGLYRFRMGDYRAIFEIDGSGQINILVILKVKHRKEIYRFE
ncbi:type II toxin-antitoxin system RelE/ParE family toxin [Candidatus Uhrbacteria bacterium]|nr:type II toxin-antitoxin system RelE/ParE family toxin [Candidatus Uhrbacteria bacterium]